MVKEFTDLQGIVGGLYAKAQGEPEAVCARDLRTLQAAQHGGFDSRDARGPDRRARRQARYAARVLPDRPDADRLERSVRAAPRRAGSGEDSGRSASSTYRLARLARADGELREFLLERVQHYFREIRGYKYDEVNAVISRRHRDDLRGRRGTAEARCTKFAPPKISSRSPPASSESATFCKQADSRPHRRHCRRVAQGSGPETRALRGVRKSRGRLLGAYVRPRPIDASLLSIASVARRSTILRQGYGERRRTSDVRANRLTLASSHCSPNFPRSPIFRKSLPQETKNEKLRLQLRRRHRRRRRQDERCPRRQRRRPRRNEPRRRARASRLHHLHRSLQHLFPERQQGSRRNQRSDSERARQARSADRQEAGRSRKSAAGQRPLRREVLHARHDEHHSQPRPERQNRGRPGQAHRQSALRLRFLPPLHSDVRRSRARYRHGEVRPYLRCAQTQSQGQARYRSRPPTI